MPKKNGFFIFMSKRKEEIVASGKYIPGGLAAISKVVDPEWQALSELEKQKYKEMADAYNKKIKAEKPVVIEPEPKPLVEQIIDDVETLYIESEIEGFDEPKLRDIFGMMTQDQDVEDISFVLIKFSCYEDAPGEILAPAEVGMCAFSVKQGIFDNYAALIDPGTLKSSKTQWESRAQQLAVPDPDYSLQLQNYHSVFHNMGMFITEHSSNPDGDTVLFCMNKDMKTTAACMEWVFKKVGIKLRYKLLPLDWFIHHISCFTYTDRLTGGEEAKVHGIRFPSDFDLYDSDQDDHDIYEPLGPSLGPSDIQIMTTTTKNYVTTPRNHPSIRKGIFFNPSHVDLFLDADNYSYHQELACLYHMDRGDGVQNCPLNTMNRYAYSLMHVMLQNFHVNPKAGWHFPNVDRPDLERARRRQLLTPWTKVNYAELAAAEKAKDIDFIEATAAALVEMNKGKC